MIQMCFGASFTFQERSTLGSLPCCISSRSLFEDTAVLEHVRKYQTRMHVQRFTHPRHRTFVHYGKAQLALPPALPRIHQKLMSRSHASASRTLSDRRQASRVHVSCRVVACRAVAWRGVEWSLTSCRGGAGRGAFRHKLAYHLADLVYSSRGANFTPRQSRQSWQCQYARSRHPHPCSPAAVSPASSYCYY